jgi:hypothetical protein
VQGQLAAAGLQDRPFALDLFDHRKTERILIEIDKPADVLDVEDDAVQGDVHGADIRMRESGRTRH